MSDFNVQDIIEELQKLRLEVEALKQSSSRQTKKQPCKGTTGKGTPCRNGAVPGCDFCRMHSRAPKPTKEVVAKKEPKVKKVQPEHTHAIGEVPEHPCPLCETHGDVLDPELPGAEFEGDDISERLRQLLSQENVWEIWRKL